MNLLDVHAKSLKLHTSQSGHGRPITLEDPQGTIYLGLEGVFNYVEHGLKIDDFENPIGAKSNVYIDRDSLQTETGEIKPAVDWKLTGAANSYDEEETFHIDSTKDDKQVPGIILFLSKVKPGAVSWDGEK